MLEAAVKLYHCSLFAEVRAPSAQVLTESVIAPEDVPGATGIVLNPIRYVPMPEPYGVTFIWYSRPLVMVKNV